MLTIDHKRTALLAMDLQTDIVTMLGDKAKPVVEGAGRMIAAARQAGIPIIYIQVGFRPGYPELSPRSPMYTVVTQSGRFVLGAPGTDIVPALRPYEGDIVIVKHRVSAFSGTDLETILRAKGIDTLLLMGISTSGVVLSTVRHGSDADYRLVVIKDCCGDMDDEVHRVLTEKVLARQATVTLAGDVMGALSNAAPA